MRLACAGWSILCALCAVSLQAGELLDGSATPCESCCPADGCPDDSLGSCSEDCDCFCGQRVLGFLPSDHCFDSFISPISNPFFFEDPRSLTEARGIFINNSLPGQLGGKQAQVWAMQFRGRLTDRFSVIAPRLAYWEIVPRGSDSPIGFLSAPVGVKYNFVRDVERQLLISGGITYFIPGSTRAYSGFGDGDLHFFLTGGKQIYDYGHWLSASGFRIPLDHNWGTQLWYWSNQWDYELPGHIYPLVGLNWYHWMRNSGLGLTGPIAGLDLVNLPAANVAGRDVVTSVIGTKWKPNGNFEVGGGYEFPLTQNHDVLSSRVYADVIFRY
jgi:hypothetical protein